MRWFPVLQVRCVAQGRPRNPPSSSEGARNMLPTTYGVGSGWRVLAGAKSAFKVPDRSLCVVLAAYFKHTACHNLQLVRPPGGHEPQEEGGAAADGGAASAQHGSSCVLCSDLQRAAAPA